MNDLLTIEVVYARTEKQWLQQMSIVKDTDIEQVIKQSELKVKFPEIDLNNLKYGIFSRLVNNDYQLQDGDRIEIYRPLMADPKLARKKRAKKGKG